MNRQSGAHRAKSICHDCDPATQAEMLAEGRCGHPEAFFVAWPNWLLDGEVEVIGLLPSNNKHTPRKFRASPEAAAC